MTKKKIGWVVMYRTRAGNWRCDGYVTTRPADAIQIFCHDHSRHTKLEKQEWVARRQHGLVACVPAYIGLADGQRVGWVVQWRQTPRRRWDTDLDMRRGRAECVWSWLAATQWSLDEWNWRRRKGLVRTVPAKVKSEDTSS